MADESVIYLDACCFIEVVKHKVSEVLLPGRENEVWYINKLLQAHRDREITVYTSTLSIAEANHVGKAAVPAEVQSAFDALLTSGQYVYLIQPDPFICIDARNLRWRDNIALKGADAIHLASALSKNCTEFITMDGRFSRIQAQSSALGRKGLAIRMPSQTVELPEKYKQNDLLDSKTNH